MLVLDSQVKQQIINLLTPLTMSEQERRALLTLAFVNHPLLSLIDFGGPTLQFLSNVTEYLYEFGKLDDGRPALWVLLEASRQYVGLDQKHRIDVLRTTFELPPAPRLDRIFISYTQQNERYAQRIASDLKDAGLRIRFDGEKLKGGDAWWQSIVRGITNADYFLFGLSPASIRSETARNELLTARQQGKPIFTLMLDDYEWESHKDDFPEVSWLSKLHIIDFTQPEKYSSSLQELIQSLPGYTPPDDFFIDELDPRDLPNPFRGLEAFFEVDSPYFFGREEAVQDLLDRLQDWNRPRLLAVVGASGSGKSSLVRAGLIPALRKALPFWETLTIRPGSDPISALADRLQDRLGSGFERTRERLRETLSALDDIAAELLAGKPEDARFVLVIDQFEELFTLASEDECKTMLKLLVFALNRTKGRFQLILTMRADFFDRFSTVPELAKLVRENLDIVSDPNPEQLRRSIEGAARKVGVLYEDGLTRQILDDVREQPGSLPLMQYALKELFERKSGRRMTHEAYVSIGGVKGALASRAENIYAELDAVQQEALQRILLRLVEVREEGNTLTRRLVPREDFSFSGITNETVQTVLNRLTSADARLLVASAPIEDTEEKNNSQTFYDVTHEALFSHWKRLAQWITQNRDDLRLNSEILSLAKTWEITGRKETSYLLTGGRLVIACDWLLRGDPNLIQREFVNESSRFHEKQLKHEFQLQQRILNRTRFAAITFAIFLIVAIGLSLLALDSQRQAESFNIDLQTQILRADNNAATSQSNANSATMAQGLAELNQQTAVAEANLRATQQAIAERNAVVSQSLSLSASARENVSNADFDLASYLALSAVSIPDPPMASQRTIYQVAYSPGTRHLFEGDWQLVTAIDFSSDSRFALVGTSDGRTLLFDLVNMQLVRKFGDLGRLRGVISKVGFGPNGTDVFSISELDKRGIVWDANSGEELRVFSGDPTSGSVVSPDGRLYIWQDQTEFSVIDTTTGQEQGRLVRTDAELLGSNQIIAISDDNHWAVSGARTVGAGLINVVLWDLTSFEQVQALTVPNLQSLAIASDNRTVLISSLNLLIVWDIVRQEELRQFSFPFATDVINFTPDPNIAVLTSSGGTSLLWNTQTGEELYRFSDSGGVMIATRLSPDGKFLLSSTKVGELRLWDLGAGQLLASFPSSDFWVSNLLSVTNQNTFLSTSADGYARVWDLTSHQLIHQIKPGNGSMGLFLNAALSPDGKTAVLTDRDIWLWNTQSGLIENKYTYPRDSQYSYITAVTFSPNGHDIAYFAGELVNPGKLILQDTADFENIRYIQLIRDDLSQTITNSLEFSRDGNRLLATHFGVDDGRNLYSAVVLYDVTTQIPLREFISDASLTKASFDADESHILASTINGDILVWDIESGEIIQKYIGHSNPVLSFAQHNNILASGDLLGTVIVWDMITQAEIFRFRASPYGVRRLLFHGDDLIIGAQNGNITLWNILTTLTETVDWIYSNRYIANYSCQQLAIFVNTSLCESFAPQIRETGTPYTNIVTVPTSIPVLHPLSTIVDGETEDWGGQLWLFTASAGDTIDIILQTVEFDGRLLLKSASGEILVQNDDSGDGSNPGIYGFNIPETGEYFIIARKPSQLAQDGKNSYTLILSLQPSSQSQNPLELNHAIRGVMGIGFEPVLGSGIKINTVSPGKPGDIAGLQIDDVIVAINGYPIGSISSNDEILDWLAFPVQSEIILTIQKGQQLNEVRLVYADPAAVVDNLSFPTAIPQD